MVNSLNLFTNAGDKLLQIFMSGCDASNLAVTFDSPPFEVQRPQEMVEGKLWCHWPNGTAETEYAVDADRDCLQSCVSGRLFVCVIESAERRATNVVQCHEIFHGENVK